MMDRFIKILLSAFLVLASLSMEARAKKTDSLEVVPFDRGIGISTSTFIPKGSIGAGAAFSWNNYSLGNGVDDAGYSMLFSLIGDIHGSMTSFGIAPYVSYFIRDNLAVGLRFDYDRSSLGLGNLNLNVMEDLDLGISDFRYFKQGYSGAVTLRNYIPFANSKRFAMFTEIRATGGYAQSETYRTGYDEILDEHYKAGTYQDIYSFELGLVPGICAFITNEAALEVSVGLLGFNYKKVVQTENQVNVSVMESSGANFKVNLLSINIGISFYIPTGKHRPAKAAKS